MFEQEIKKYGFFLKSGSSSHDNKIYMNTFDIVPGQVTWKNVYIHNISRYLSVYILRPERLGRMRKNETFLQKKSN